MKKQKALNVNLDGSAVCLADRYRPQFINTSSLFLFTVLLFGSSAQAQSELSKVWFNTGFYSAHFDTDKGLRNPNPGFGIEYKLTDDLSLTAGGFTNSDNAHSNYLGAYYQPWRLGGVKLGGWAVYLMAIQKLLMAGGFLRCCQSQAGSLKT